MTKQCNMVHDFVDYFFQKDGDAFIADLTQMKQQYEATCKEKLAGSSPEAQNRFTDFRARLSDPSLISPTDPSALTTFDFSKSLFQTFKDLDLDVSECISTITKYADFTKIMTNHWQGLEIDAQTIVEVGVQMMANLESMIYPLIYKFTQYLVSLSGPFPLVGSPPPELLLERVHLLMQSLILQIAQIGSSCVGTLGKLKSATEASLQSDSKKLGCQGKYAKSCIAWAIKSLSPVLLFYYLQQTAGVSVSANTASPAPVQRPASAAQTYNGTSADCNSAVPRPATCCCCCDCRSDPPICGSLSSYQGAMNTSKNNTKSGGQMVQQESLNKCVEPPNPGTQNQQIQTVVVAQNCAANAIPVKVQHQQAALPQQRAAPLSACREQEQPVQRAAMCQQRYAPPSQPQQKNIPICQKNSAPIPQQTGTPSSTQTVGQACCKSFAEEEERIRRLAADEERKIKQRAEEAECRIAKRLEEGDKRLRARTEEGEERLRKWTTEEEKVLSVRPKTPVMDQLECYEPPKPTKTRRRRFEDCEEPSPKVQQECDEDPEVQPCDPEPSQAKLPVKVQEDCVEESPEVQPCDPEPSQPKLAFKDKLECCIVPEPTPCEVVEESPKPCEEEPPQPCDVETLKPCDVEPLKPCDVEPLKPCDVEPPKPYEIEPPPCDVEPPKPCEAELPPCDVEPPKPCEAELPPCDVEPPKPCEAELPPCDVEPPKPCKVELPPCDVETSEPCEDVVEEIPKPRVKKPPKPCAELPKPSVERSKPLKEDTKSKKSREEQPPEVFLVKETKELTTTKVHTHEGQNPPQKEQITQVQQQKEHPHVDNRDSGFIENFFQKNGLSLVTILTQIKDKYDTKCKEVLEGANNEIRHDAKEFMAQVHDIRKIEPETRPIETKNYNFPAEMSQVLTGLDINVHDDLEIIKKYHNYIQGMVNHWQYRMSKGDNITGEQMVDGALQFMGTTMALIYPVFIKLSEFLGQLTQDPASFKDKFRPRVMAEQFHMLVEVCALEVGSIFTTVKRALGNLREAPAELAGQVGKMESELGLAKNSISWAMKAISPILLLYLINTDKEGQNDKLDTEHRTVLEKRKTALEIRLRRQEEMEQEEEKKSSKSKSKDHHKESKSPTGDKGKGYKAPAADNESVAEREVSADQGHKPQKHGKPEEGQHKHHYEPENGNHEPKAGKKNSTGKKQDFVAYFLVQGKEHLEVVNKFKREYDKLCDKTLPASSTGVKKKARNYLSQIHDFRKVAPSATKYVVGEFNFIEKITSLLQGYDMELGDDLDALTKYDSFTKKMVLQWLAKIQKGNTDLDPDSVVDVGTQMMAQTCLLAFPIIIKMGDFIRHLIGSLSNHKPKNTAEKVAERFHKFAEMIAMQVSAIGFACVETLSKMPSMNREVFDSLSNKLAEQTKYATNSIAWGMKTLGPALLYYFIKYESN